MVLEKKHRDVLQEAQNHIEKAYSLIMTELNIKEKEGIERKTGVDIESMTIQLHNGFLRVLAQYGMHTMQDEEQLSRLYEQASPDKIHEYEKRMEQLLTDREKLLIQK